MRYLKFMNYLFLIPAILDFITSAQEAMKDAAGEDKKRTVLEKFTALVVTLGSVGLISPVASARLLAGASALIDFVVALLKGIGYFQGGDGATDSGDTGNAFREAYVRMWPTDPRQTAEAVELYASNDVVWQVGSQFQVTQAGVGTPMPEGAVRLGTFRP
jgi:hypothetical protein